MIEKSEIWFRGKSSATKEWIEGYFLKKKFYRSDAALCSYISIPHPGLNRRPSDDILVIFETVGQYTGTPDKNKNKIFECDIVKAFKNNEEPFVAVVTKRNGCFWFGNWNWCEFLDKFRNYEVIGNVFDNPELLKGGSEYVEENEDG